jgi:hypothetical protein
MVGVIQTALRALLVPPVRTPGTLSSASRTAELASIAVPAVAGRADGEQLPAPEAAQQVQEDAGRQSLAHEALPRVDKQGLLMGSSPCPQASRPRETACRTLPRSGGYPPGLLLCGREAYPIPHRRASGADDQSGLHVSGQKPAVPGGRQHAEACYARSRGAHGPARSRTSFTPQTWRTSFHE